MNVSSRNTSDPCLAAPTALSKTRIESVDSLRFNGFARRTLGTSLVVLLTFLGQSASAEAVKTGATTTESSTWTQDEGIPTGLLFLPVSSNYFSPYAFVVDKTARTLSVWQQTNEGPKRIAHFPADLGKAPGNKRNRGDHKTPEGVYFVQEQLEGASLDFKQYGKRAFPLDYPNLFDRLEGKTGYGIWLHAIPDETPLTRGSRGCVVVRNDVILDLTKYIKLGRTPVLIQEKTEKISVAEHAKRSEDIMKWLESWRTTWEAKDLEAYIANYDDDFRALKMNKAQWRTHKSNLNSQYNSITVRLSHPAIYADRDRAIVRFLQQYTSDQHSDVGEKTLFLKKSPNGYRILSETWVAETSPLARQEIETAHASRTSSTPSCTKDGQECAQKNASRQ